MTRILEVFVTVLRALLEISERTLTRRIVRDARNEPLPKELGRDPKIKKAFYDVEEEIWEQRLRLLTAPRARIP